MLELRAGATLFVGLGMMGAPMARCYARSRRPMVIFDLDVTAARSLAQDLEAVVLNDLRDVGTNLVDTIDTVILMLPNSRVVESVLGTDAGDGLLGRLPAGSLVIDMGSSEPSSTRVLANIAKEYGIDYVDAPVSGGVTKAESGDLAVMLGGTPEALARARKHVDPLAANMIDIGPSGAGHAAKALNNWLSAANIAAASEILAIAVREGIAPDTMIATLNASTGRSQATELKFPKFILTGTYDSKFAFELMRKDLAIAARLAGDVDGYIPVLDAVLSSVDNTRKLFDSDQLDHTEIARFYEQKNNVKFS